MAELTVLARGLRRVAPEYLLYGRVSGLDSLLGYVKVGWKN